ncbi:tyrosine--tRNA ligase [Stomatohabitans albus]|uniref:tyrosine--tRNA ligase n=1 Tax=Stomatohabitans albus TaxID=3110766 RepID=UPI00300C4504
MSTLNAFDVLTARGLVYDCTDEAGLRDAFAAGPVTFYVGFDPTADSLHAGNLVGIMAMAHLQRLGHRAIALAGGATGRVGDPSGRDVERQLLDEATLERNLAAIRTQLAFFLDFSTPERGLLVDNYDWMRSFSFMDALRVIGPHFSVNQMISRESVRKRLETREQGLTYTEFSYQLLQAWDFWHLYKHEGARLQGGGSDQWGNITAGTDLIGKMAGPDHPKAFGLTWPLLTTAAGVKFGKSAGNAVWLDREKTSPYGYYQFWINAADADVERFLKIFTFLELDEIDEIVAKHGEAPHLREGQKRLAAEATRIVHGEDGLTSAIKTTEVLFGAEPFTDLPAAIVREAFAEAPTVEVSSDVLAGETPISKFLVEAGACASQSEAKRLIGQGAVRLNNRVVTQADRPVDTDDVTADAIIIIRVGKKRHFLATLV